MKNKSPLRYPGGKTRACATLDEIVNKYFNMDEFDTIVSPFVGGGSFEFYLQNKYDKLLVVNDKFTPLFNFWEQCVSNKQSLCDVLSEHQVAGISKEEFAQHRKDIMDADKDNEFKQAIHYFIINRCSFSGATLSGGYSQQASKKRFTASSVDRVLALDLSNFTIYNEDFESFMCTHCTSNTFTFVDPPYYLQKKSKLYGKNGDMHEQFDHVKLARVLRKTQHWLLTYNDCDYIRNLYKEYTILPVIWSYGMNKSKKSSEIVIICY